MTVIFGFKYHLQEWDKSTFEGIENSGDESISSDHNGMRLIRWEHFDEIVKYENAECKYIKV